MTTKTMVQAALKRAGLVPLMAVVGVVGLWSIGSAVAMDSAAELVDGPSLGISKTVSAPPVKNDDSSYSMEFLITVANLGDEDLSELQVTDDLETAFGAGSIMIVDGVAPSPPFDVNPSYDGEIGGDQNLLSGTDVLPAGETMTITLAVTVAPEIAPPGPFANSAIAAAVAADGMPLSDESSPGSMPAADDIAEPTSFTFNPAPAIGAAKELVAGPTRNDDGSFTMSFHFVVDNLGNTPLLGLRLDDDLQIAFGSGSTVEVLDLTASAPFVANPDFDGFDDFRLLPEVDTLGIGESMTVDLTISVLPAQLGTFENLAYAKGLSPANVPVVDETVDGPVSDPDLDGDAVEHFVPTPVVLVDGDTVASTTSTTSTSTSSTTSTTSGSTSTTASSTSTTVTPAAGPSSSVPFVSGDQLPVTGGRNVAMLVAGFVLMAGGVALIVGTRREIAKRSYFLR